MKALYYLGDTKMALKDIPIPQPAKDEYLVKVDACGICGSDFEGFLGKTGRRTAPMIMGHECSGEIVSVPCGGQFAEGTKVAVFPKYYCGQCQTCKDKVYQLCPHGKFLGVMDFNGAMTEYLCAREEYIVPVEKPIPAEIAAMAEPLAVSYSGVSKLTRQKIENADNIIVIGAGTIGLLALLVLKQRGAKRVIVSDTFDIRLELAKTMGADAVINPAKADFKETLLNLTDGALCDIAIEAVGVSSTAQSSLDALKTSGTAIWIGNAQKMVQVDMQKIVTTELSIQGNYLYSKDDFVTCLRLLEEGDIDVRPLITDRMNLAEGVEAFEKLRSNTDGRTVKIMLCMT
jgi:L-iditol 2-dehydrogenase